MESDPADARTGSSAAGRAAAPIPRSWRWVPVLVGAVVETVAVAPIGPLPFYLTPLVLGLTYVAAASVGGRHATLWAPGMVITAWGAGVVLVFSQTLHVDLAPVAVTALGGGAVAAALLGRAGFRVDALAIALSVLLAGLTELAASLGVHVLSLGWLYGALLGSWVLADLSGLSSLLHRSRPRVETRASATPHGQP
jgi:hypothetical protein